MKSRRDPAAEFRSSLRGRVIGPGDPDFDSARALVYGGLDKRPSVIARVAGPDDVARVIEFARETGLDLAVRSGGHSLAGYSTTEGGVVLDVRDLSSIEIDASGRTAWAGSGMTAAAYSVATAVHGLATGFGDTGSVGLGGLTLGGGLGYLSRKHGLTIDSLLAAELVTADGRVLHVDEMTHPDLFWAIRGGGGNFGVATRFRLRLHPVDRVVGGMLILPATPETVAGFVAESEAASDDLTTIANVMNLPPMPFVPEEHHGRLAIMGILCHAGDIAAGERTIGRFRALGEPIADMVQPIPYPSIYPPEDPDYHPTAATRNMFMDHVGPAEAALIVDRLEASDASLRVVQLRVHGGAIARVPAEATAFAHRTSPIMANVAAFYEGPYDRLRKEAWVEEVAGALNQGDSGAYVGFLGDEGERRTRAAYPGATWDRLRSVKARYDPDNVFHLNQNVPPG